LENDPRRIYQFVRNHFTYVPYYGALKGPYLTLKERSGNDFDQAALLVELLRAAGYTANYQYGNMSIPLYQLPIISTWRTGWVPTRMPLASALLLPLAEYRKPQIIQALH
jgi:transglutaminase-like putative cysteine protease